MSGHDNVAAGADAERLPPAVGKRLLSIAGAIAAVGILLGLAAAFSDPERFAFSYLAGFYYCVTAGVGALIWIIIQHLAKAGWSVAARRQLEWVAGFLPVAIVLFIPVALLAPHTYSHWWAGPAHVAKHEEGAAPHAGAAKAGGEHARAEEHKAEGEHAKAEEHKAEGEHAAAGHEGEGEGDEPHVDETLAKKQAFLNPATFYGLSALFLLIWAGASWFFRSNSLAQDVSGDPKVTLRMQKFAPPFIFAVGYSLAFSGLLWIMSMDPHWFSTMWGVYCFAGSMTSSMAIVALLTAYLQANGYFRRVSTVEHLHDIGKLLFAFVVFFAYIGFCQFFLIWYGNIPEETVFFKRRVVEGWKTVSYSLPILHFAVPFLWLLPRTVKRSHTGLAIGAIIMLVMHYVDMYWMVMPNLDPEGAHFTWIDVAGLMAPLGVMLLAIAYRASRDPIYPLKDPRVAETIRNDNGQG